MHKHVTQTMRVIAIGIVLAVSATLGPVWEQQRVDDPTAARSGCYYLDGQWHCDPMSA